MKYWLVDSIPIHSSDSIQRLVTRLNRLEENGYTIEGIEFYGQYRDQCLIISNKETDEEKEVQVITDDEEPPL